MEAVPTRDPTTTVEDVWVVEAALKQATCGRGPRAVSEEAWPSLMQEPWEEDEFSARKWSCVGGWEGGGWRVK